MNIINEEIVDIEEEFEAFIQENDAECRAHDAHEKDVRLLDQEELLTTLKRTTFEYKAINDALYDKVDDLELEIDDLKYEHELEIEDSSDVLRDTIQHLLPRIYHLLTNRSLGDKHIQAGGTLKCRPARNVKVATSTCGPVLAVSFCAFSMEWRLMLGRVDCEPHYS